MLSSAGHRAGPGACCQREPSVCLYFFFMCLITHQLRCILCDGFSSNVAVFLPFILAVFKCSAMITFSDIAWKTLIIRFKS